jgi:hypothetical protein
VKCSERPAPVIPLNCLAGRRPVQRGARQGLAGCRNIAPKDRFLEGAESLVNPASQVDDTVCRSKLEDFDGAQSVGFSTQPDEPVQAQRKIVICSVPFLYRPNFVRC